MAASRSFRFFNVVFLLLVFFSYEMLVNNRSTRYWRGIKIVADVLYLQTMRNAG